MRVGCE
jgi:26S proteasome regulatory subunit T1